MAEELGTLFLRIVHVLLVGVILYAAHRNEACLALGAMVGLGGSASADAIQTASRVRRNGTDKTE